MSGTEGASYEEQLLDLCRRNNELLVKSIFQELADPEKIASLINETRDPLGDAPLHIATKYGNYAVLDLLLDQEGVETDPKTRIDGNTPLHLAVKYLQLDPEYGKFLVEELLEVGADPKVKNKYGEKPVDLVRGDDAVHQELRDVLEEALYADMVGHDQVLDGVQNVDLGVSDEEEEEYEEAEEDEEEEEEEEEGKGSAPPPPMDVPPPPPPK